MSGWTLRAGSPRARREMCCCGGAPHAVHAVRFGMAVHPATVGMASHSCPAAETGVVAAAGTDSASAALMPGRLGEGRYGRVYKALKGGVQVRWAAMHLSSPPTLLLIPLCSFAPPALAAAVLPAAVSPAAATTARSCPCHSPPTHVHAPPPTQPPSGGGCKASVPHGPARQGSLCQRGGAEGNCQ